MSEDMKEMNKIRKVIRTPHLAQQIVIVDGHPGCGKTMLSPIVAALDRVELLTYAYEVEHMCSLHLLGKIETDAAVSMVRLLTDLQLYNTMMGRETNFRPGDLSSVWMDIDPWRYVKRIFSKGDECVPQRIAQERPILHLTTHNLLAMAGPVFEALKERLVFIEVVRHPLYVIKQHVLNMERLMEDSRHFTLYSQYGDQNIPCWTHGWEEKFVNSNSADKAIYSIQKLKEMSDKVQEGVEKKYDAKIIEVPFERFVINPKPFLEKIIQALGSQLTLKTEHMLKKQNVPREKFSSGIGLKVYKRCGWQPPVKGSTEEEEFASRRDYVAQQASSEGLKILDRLSERYEEQYLGKKYNYQ